jgi:hypothetical protein
LVSWSIITANTLFPWSKFIISLIIKNFPWSHLWLILVKENFKLKIFLMLLYVFFFFSVSPGTIFYAPLRRTPLSIIHQISHIDSTCHSAGLIQIWKVKVKGQGHSDFSKSQIGSRLAHSLIKLESCNIHQSIQRIDMYNNEWRCYCSQMHRSCVILHNSNWDFLNANISVVKQVVALKFAEYITSINILRNYEFEWSCTKVKVIAVIKAFSCINYWLLSN